MSRDALQRRPQAAPRAGFTLTELIVVMIIIGVVAALLFGALGGARETARSVRCVANLKGMGGLLALEATKNGGAITPYEADGVRWFEKIHDLSRDQKGELFLCPSDREAAFTVDKLSYGMNCDVKDATASAAPYTSSSSPAGDDLNADTYNLTEIVNPAQFILLADSGYVREDAKTHRSVRAWIASAKFHGDSHAASGMHKGRANILYGDFHVDARSASGQQAGNINGTDAEIVKLWTLGNE